MNSSRDKVIDRIESAQRMLIQAREQHGKGNTEDAVTFLEVAGTRIKAAIEAVNTKPISFSDYVAPTSKEAARAR